MKAKIMAIGNVTPDSFYPASRLTNSEQLEVWAHNALEDGADILDLGGCSTRPGSTPVDQEEEWRRVEPALNILKHKFPETQLSLDTFRPEIARRALDQFGPMIINDISGGCETMYQLVRDKKVPYVWTLRGDLTLPSRMPYICEIENLILDPGFGFIGSTEADYACMRNMDTLRRYNRPVLVGVSRKSMVYKPLGLTPDTCLAATQALQMYALAQGATILRTHDVRATAHTLYLYKMTQ